MTAPTNPICRDCRHSTMRRMHYFPIIRVLHCAHPSVLNCVSGEPVYTCAELRTTDSQFCGRAGAQWEAVNIVETRTKAYAAWLNGLPVLPRSMLWADLCETAYSTGPWRPLSPEIWHDAEMRDAVKAKGMLVTPDGPKIAKRFAAKVATARTRAKKTKP